MNNEIMILVNQYETKGDFTHVSLTEEKKTVSEEKLGLKLNPAFAEFLKEFGHGGICGIEIYGIGKNGDLIFVNETLKYREYGLPDNLIVIENCDEWIYCIDSYTGAIVSWTSAGIQKAYASFEEYLLDRFSDASENM